MRELRYASLDEQSQALQQGKVSSVELTQMYLGAIAEKDKNLGAFLTVTADHALQQAQAADVRLKKKDRLTPLTGIPIALKDIFLTQGIKTTCASKILANFIPPYESTTSLRLQQAGAVLLGKLNMDEFAMGSSTENSAFQLTRNPWNLEFIPGGSSGGSASAVAGGLCAGTFGTDTGGSIRQPASHTSIVGLKPTYGRISRYGVIAFASSLDQVGPMARTVKDVAHLLKAVAGHDPHDSTSAPVEVPDYAAALSQSGGILKKITFGIPRQFVDRTREGIDPEVIAAFDRAVEKYKSLGAKIIDVDLPNCTDCAVATYYIIAPAEASSNLARYDGVRYGHRSPHAQTLADLYKNSRAEGFGKEVKRRIMLGTYVLSAGYYDAYYLKALKVRRLIRNDFDRAFKNCDAVISPVTPTPPFKLGEKLTNPMQMYLSDIFTIAVNLAGLPGLSVPCGFNSQKLPIGLQIIGKPFDETKLLQLAHGYEQACDWWQQHPSF